MGRFGRLVRKIRVAATLPPGPPPPPQPGAARRRCLRGDPARASNFYKHHPEKRNGNRGSALRPILFFFIGVAAGGAFASESRDVVAWRAWGDEAFAEARGAERPVLLVIADPACGACREEEREAANDEEAARLVNAAFVPITVDRFDRPDLAQLYSVILDVPHADQRGALVVFLLPDGRPFAAQWGLSRIDRDGSPGLWTLAARRLSDFRQERPAVEAAAAGNLERMRRAQQADPPRGPLGRDVVDAALKGLRESFDAKGGGFGPEGEVPAGAPRLLLEQGAERSDAAALRMASAALDRMALGGDDARAAHVLWRDAVLLRALAQSYATTGRAAHRAAAEALATRILAEMRDGNGGFVALRSPQLKDDRVIAGWNGLMIGALATSGSLLGRAADIEAAAQAAARVRERLGSPGTLRRSVRADVPGGPALLEDYAYLADGLLDLHAATGDARWLTDAAFFAEAAVRRFLDAAHGGFFTTDARAPVSVRLKQAFDAPLPSPNGVMARVLLRLDRATGERSYGALARATVDAFRGDLQRAPRGMETMVGVAAEILAAAGGGSGSGGGAAAARPARTVAGPVTLEASLSNSRVPPGGSVEARLTLRIAKGFRVVARDPGVKDLFGLTVSVLGEGLTNEGPRYPAARQEPGPWNTGAVSVYAGEAAITIPIRVSRRALPGEMRVGLRVVFQPCDGSSCQPPLSARAEVPLTIEAPP